MCTGHTRSGALPTSGLQPGCGPHPCVGLHFSLPEALGEATGAKKRAGPFEAARGRPLRGSSGPPREEEELPTGTGSFSSLTPFSGSPGSH